MKRLCIYVIYDVENRADDYIGYMLHELRKMVDCLIVVCNFLYLVKGEDNIYPYADHVYFRENKGFDAGAYKDAICQYLGWEKVYSYDEILLTNDSFYGPFYPIEDVFNMVERIDADYWGITRSPKGTLKNGYVYESHIQSYFIAFRKRVLQDELFRNFWNELPYPKTYEQAVISFELTCNQCLTVCGYKGIALMDFMELESGIREEGISYMMHPLELIRDARIPIFKRKSLLLWNKGFGNALDALRYIHINSTYDIDLIKKHLRRVNGVVHDLGTIDSIGLEKFYDTHPKVYIYGMGTYGRNLAKYFKYRGWYFEGFLVTRTENNEIDCTIFENVDLRKDDGIIIAVGTREVYMEILHIVAEKCDREQIYDVNALRNLIYEDN